MAHRPAGNNHVHQNDRTDNYIQSIDNGIGFGIRIQMPKQIHYRIYFDLDENEIDNPATCDEAHAVCVVHTMAGLPISGRCFARLGGRVPAMPHRRFYSPAAIAENWRQVQMYGNDRDAYYNLTGQPGALMGMAAHATERQLAANAGLPVGGVFPPLSSIKM